MPGNGLSTDRHTLAKALGQPVKRGSGSRPDVMIVSRNITRKYLCDGGLTPIDVMIGNMRFWSEQADKTAAQVRQMLGMLDPNVEVQADVISECVKLLGKFADARAKAQVCAVDAAPYMHPKYQQVSFRDEEQASGEEEFIELVIPLALGDEAGLPADRSYRDLNGADTGSRANGSATADATD